MFVSLHIEQATQFLDLFLAFVSQLDYPKQRMHVLVHNTQEYHRKHVAEFSEKHAADYVTFQVISPEENVTPAVARNLAVLVQKDQQILTLIILFYRKNFV